MIIPKSLKDELKKVAESEGINLYLKEVGEEEQIPFALSRRVKKNTFQVSVKKLRSNIPAENLRRILFHELGHCIFLKNNENLKNERWKIENILNFCLRNEKYFGGFLLCYEAVELFLELAQEIFAEKFSVKYCGEYSPLTNSEDKESVEKLKKLKPKQKLQHFEKMVLKRYGRWDSVTFIKDIATWGRFIILCSSFPDKYGCKEILSTFPNEFKENMVKLGKIMDESIDLIEKLRKSKFHLKKVLELIFEIIHKKESLKDEEIIKEFYSRNFKPKQREYIKKDNNLVRLILETEFNIKI